MAGGKFRDKKKFLKKEGGSIIAQILHHYLLQKDLFFQVEFFFRRLSACTKSKKSVRLTFENSRISFSGVACLTGEYSDFFLAISPPVALYIVLRTNCTHRTVVGTVHPRFYARCCTALYKLKDCCTAQYLWL